MAGKNLTLYLNGGLTDHLKQKLIHGEPKLSQPTDLKLNQRLRRYLDIIEKDKDLCLGSYCFLWGQKQESTSTWHGMYLSNGHPTEAVDVMQILLEGNGQQKEHQV